MPETNATQARPLPSPLPAGFTCPSCGYDLGGSTAGRCSECGREVSFGEVAAFEARGEALHKLHETERRLWKQRGLWAAVLLVGATLATLNVFIILFVGVLSLMTVGIDALIMTAALVAVPRNERMRDVVRLSWVRSALWLHGPCGVVMAAIWCILVPSNVAGPWTPSFSEAASVAGVLLWVLSAIGSPLGFFIKLDYDLLMLGVPTRWWRMSLVLGILASGILNALLSISIMMLAFLGGLGA